MQRGVDKLPGQPSVLCHGRDDADGECALAFHFRQRECPLSASTSEISTPAPARSLSGSWWRAATCQYSAYDPLSSCIYSVVLDPRLSRCLNITLRFIAPSASTVVGIHLHPPLLLRILPNCHPFCPPTPKPARLSFCSRSSSSRFFPPVCFPRRVRPHQLATLTPNSSPSPNPTSLQSNQPDTRSQSSELATER
jgi:hypothetical protein